MAYDLSRLGSERFEHLIQALAIGAIGPGIQIFGIGPDGGREATFDGVNNFEGKGTWNGYGVIQAKYKAKLLGPRADQSWFFEQVTAELDRWVDPRTKRTKKPKYFVIATNVALSAVAADGGIDRLNDLIAKYRTRKDKRGRPVGLPGLADYDLWHAERIERLLEAKANVNVRRTYADLVLPGDVISRLYDMLKGTEETLAQAWIGHVSRAVRADTTVELGESGDHANEPLALADVAVDLPVESSAGPTSTALAALVARADNVLSASMKPVHGSRIVILGGPGTGKSTLSRILCQIYRTALLLGDAGDRITYDASVVAVSLRESFDKVGLPRPTLHRLPVRVVLSTYADAVSRPNPPTLLEYITEIINARGSDSISVAQCKLLMAKWPSIMVLDGLDEVASAEVRTDVVTRIQDFLEEMAACGADVLTICTSRPSGFDLANRITVEELHLKAFEVSDALRYGARLVAQRFPAEPSRQELTLQRLREAAEGTETRRLMTSPLQVTILALILEQRTRAPSSRFTLFNAYYDTIYARERNKPGGHGDLLETHRPIMTKLHQLCALRIHAWAELAGQADSILANDELAAIARSLLESEGYRAGQIESLLADILNLAQQRLVLLVARGDGVAFEVRSLAEFFAARALMSDVDAVDHLEAMAPSAHWRNTWLLAAGYIFAERTELRDAVVAVLDRIDKESWANRLVQPGAVLAREALTDGFSAYSPKYERHLAVQALRILDGPIGSHLVELAKTLSKVMADSEPIAISVWAEVDARLAEARVSSARAFLSCLEDVASEGVALVAASRLANYDSNASSQPSRPVIASSADNERRRQEAHHKLEGLGIGSPPNPTADQLVQMLRHTDDGASGSTRVRPTREIIVEALFGDIATTSAARDILSQMIERDDVSHRLPVE